MTHASLTYYPLRPIIIRKEQHYVHMIFIETPIFTEDVKQLLPDKEYGEFQQHLADNPKKGDVIQGTGGLRKIRWSAQGKGKRGGIRVIYYHLEADAQIRLILIYKKGIQDNLTTKQTKLLKQINEGWQRNG